MSPFLSYIGQLYLVKTDLWQFFSFSVFFLLPTAPKGEDGGGVHSCPSSTRARAGPRGKGAPAALDLLSPLTEAAATSPLAKMAAFRFMATLVDLPHSFQLHHVHSITYLAHSVLMDMIVVFSTFCLSFHVAMLS